MIQSGWSCAGRRNWPGVFGSLPLPDRCQFQDCAHLKEKGCAVLAAVKAGEIPKSRHDSYVRLYEQAKQIPDWEQHK